MTTSPEIHHHPFVPSSPTRTLDVVVVGAGPAGVVAALRSARLGARTALITRDEFGGMAANDGPVPVRTLAQAARLIREAKLLPDYGITVGDLSLDYPGLLGRVREVTEDVRTHSLLRDDLEQQGVTIHERAGAARFVDAHTVESPGGLRLRADAAIICTGGRSRQLAVPGFELTATHSDAWHLAAAPPSLLVIGAGATGVQVASIFNAFGARVHLVEVAPRILMTEDEEVSEAVGSALAAAGVEIVEDAGTIERFERSASGVRMIHRVKGAEHTIEATIAVVAVGWVAATAELNLERAGVELDARGYVRVDNHQRTAAPHVFAAGDVTGRAMVVHEAIREAVVASTNAVLGGTTPLPPQVSPLGSFTDPEYASVGLTEAAAREAHDVLVTKQPFDTMARPIIDGRRTGFCKLIVDRQRHNVLGCHIVGERAVELAQLAATAMAAGMSVEQLALVPYSFPTYADAFGRTAIRAAVELDTTGAWAADHLAQAAEVGAAAPPA
jgi:pyruvate/2-oxoglutarate dehydrogenase complex dihydrolipoamide dehydrogenase (E3) component